MDFITYDDFTKVEMRIGKIIEVEDFPKARKPAYKLIIDFGEFGIKRSSAQLTKIYNKDELLSQIIVAVTNFPPKQVADFMSEVLVLGVEMENDIVHLLGVDGEVTLGKRIS